VPYAGFNTLVTHLVLIFFNSQASTFQPTHSKTKPKQKDSQRWPRGLDMEYTAYQITLSGILIPRRSLEMVKILLGTWDSFELFAYVRARQPRTKRRQHDSDGTGLFGRRRCGAFWALSLHDSFFS